MELLIFSDSHGNPHALHHILATDRTETVIHLGDGARDVENSALSDRTVYAVRGNCDFFEERPEEIVIALEGHVLLLTHGHLFGVKQGLDRLIAHGLEVGADILLFGHTHRPLECFLPQGSETPQGRLPRDMYLFNPGSIGQNVDREGYSFGRLLLRRDGVLFSHGRV